MTQKIVLGTVQLGLDYGVANSGGKIKNDEAERIIQLSSRAGITKLDTAAIYGNSEEVLGKIGVDKFDVITKVPKHPAGTEDVKKWVIGKVNASLSSLKIESIYAVMLHDASILSTSDGELYWNALSDLRKDGVINKVGYSIYEPKELDLYFEKFQPDIVQAPYNILDRRLKESGWLNKLNDNSIEVHVRSVFLQGLLLMSEKQRPQYFNQWQELWKKWDQWLLSENISALEATLGFVVNDQEIDNIVVGVDSTQQLQGILTASEKYGVIHPKLSSSDMALLNPSRWIL